MNKRFLKIIKWFFGIVLSIFLLITGGLYVFKDEICGYVIKEVNKHLNTQVSVSDVDLTFWGTFPNISVDFNNVFIQDAYKNATNRDTLLFSERIRLKFNPIDIWNEEYNVKYIEIEPGTVQLKVLENGQVNYNIIKETKDQGNTKFKLNLEQVSFEDVRFSYNNDATGQHYVTKIDEMDLEGNFTDEKYTLHAKSNLHVRQAKSGTVTLFSNKPASFDIAVQVNQKTGTVEIPNALVYLANLPFIVNGKITTSDLNFEVHSKDIQLADVANNFSMVQLDNIKAYGGTGDVYFDLFVHGKNETTSPTEIDCAFGINNGTLTEPLKNLKLKKIHLDGVYSNKGGATKEFLKLSSIRFSTPGGPFSGNLLLTDFANPKYQGNANGVINLNMLHTLFDLPHVDKVFGNLGVEAAFNVQSKVREDQSVDYSILKCEGEVGMRNVDLKLEDDKRTFRQMNGVLYLRNDEAGIDNVEFKVGKSDLQFNGVFMNIVNYFENKGHLTANVEMKSKFIDVEDLGTTSKEEKIQDGRHFVLPDNIDGVVMMDVGQIEYDNHEFNKFLGSMLVGNRKLHFPNISLRNSDADIKGNLTIEERSAEIFHITTEVTSDNLQFKPLFREWDNFQQDVIGENNISGRAQAKVYFEAPFDLRSGIISKSIKSQVYLKIRDGRLKNVDAFKSITESLKTSSTKLLIGKENIQSLEKKLLDLKFETLENTFTIQNGYLTIPKMTIHSSALDVETSGTHSFENIIDYKFTFRFRDLKDKNTVTEFGEEVDDETGMKIYMRMYGNIDDPTIVWDKLSKKEQAKENREIEKQTVRSMLKTEFGVFKNDTSVKTYIKKDNPKEVLHLEFGPTKTEDPEEELKVKKNSKIKNTLKNWKEESDKSKHEEIDFD